MNPTRLSTVLLVVAFVTVGVAGVVNGYEVASADGGSSPYERFDAATPGETRVAPELPNATVFTAYRGGNGHLVAIHANGTLWRYADRFDEYYDVDPVPRTDTVIVAAMDQLSRKECPADSSCTREVILRYNLTTGESESVYERYRPGTKNNEWHDVDRLGPDRYLIADMAKERVFVVDTNSGIIEWAWTPQSHYNISTGGSNVFTAGSYPDDWTHLNDVTVLPDGRIMVSMRNHDEVVFVDRETGVQPNWTLGEDDEFRWLYEQHQPDYIPTDRGGPAVVIADSQNDRIVEYQRRDGEWEQTWVWADDRLAWPRDADRLPNGNTLVADTNGARLIEVDEDGSVVWAVDTVPGLYDAERLQTGDESAGGHSAVAEGLTGTGAGATDTGGLDQTSQLSVLRNAVRYVTPLWFGVIDGLLTLVAFGAATAGLLLRWDRVASVVDDRIGDGGA